MSQPEHPNLENDTHEARIERRREVLEHARERGIGPVTDYRTLLGPSRLDDETENEFTEALRAMRRCTPLPDEQSSEQQALYASDNAKEVDMENTGRATKIVRPGEDASGTQSPKPSIDVHALAREQGVVPLRSIADLKADFWPEDESIDEFVQQVRKWRKEG